MCLEVRREINLASHYKERSKRDVGEALVFTQYTLTIGPDFCVLAHLKGLIALPLLPEQFSQSDHPGGNSPTYIVKVGRWSGKWNNDLRGSWAKNVQQERDKGTGAAGGTSGNLFSTEVSFQVGEDWRCRERQWRCNARARSKQRVLRRGNVISATNPPLHGGFRVLKAAEEECGVGRVLWLPAEVEQESAITGIWQGCMAGCQQRKVLLESCDMLMRPMCSGKWERGKQQVKKRQTGSDCAISAQFLRGRVPCMYFVLFVCCLTLSHMGVDADCPGKAGSEVECLDFRNTTRKELTEQWSRDISCLLT